MTKKKGVADYLRPLFLSKKDKAPSDEGAVTEGD